MDFESVLASLALALALTFLEELGWSGFRKNPGTGYKL